MTTLQAQSPHPNIIVILADDLGYGDVSFNGCPDYSTPNIDSLASRGMWCSNGYVTQAFAARRELLCSQAAISSGSDMKIKPGDDASNPRLGLPMQGLRLRDSWQMAFSRRSQPSSQSARV